MGLIHAHLWNHWYDKAKAKAMENETYATIEARRQNDDRRTVTFLAEGRDLGWREWDVQQAIFRKLNPTPWWQRLHWVLERHGIGAQWSNLKASYFRARRGWAPRDAWSLRHHLSGVIAESVTCLKKDLHGHPIDLTFEEWQDVLDRIISGFALAHRSEDLDFTAEEHLLVQEKLDEAAQLLGRWFLHLWN